MECIWIINPYCEIPKLGWRDDRYLSIAKYLSEAGYNVHLFISNFSHKDKLFTPGNIQIRLTPSLNVVRIKTKGYASHVSLKRIKYEQTFAKEIANNKLDIPLPSIIILREPAIFTYGSLKSLIKTSGAKLILDVIDLWPETFELKLPKFVRWGGKVIFFPLYTSRRKIYLAATAVTAVAPDYLNQVLRYNKAISGEVIYLGCDLANIEKELKSAEENLLNELNLPEKKDNVWGIYAGTLGEGYDITTLIEAAKRMKTIAPQLKFLIAGTGPRLEAVKTAARENSNIFYLGSLPTATLYQLFSFCDFGFSTYAEGSAVSMPIKCYDYFAAGLPLVNSLKRHLENLIITKKLGYQYKASSVDSLVEVLTLLLQDNLQEMKLRCKEISREFDESVQYAKFVKLVKSLES